MTREEVMETAYESGMIAGYEGEPDLLERFAALVAAQEREACAKVCDAHTVDDVLVGVGIGQSCAAAIRARGQA
jgi:GTP cyclohydrolase III